MQLSVQHYAMSANHRCCRVSMHRPKNWIVRPFSMAFSIFAGRKRFAALFSLLVTLAVVTYNRCRCCCCCSQVLMTIKEASKAVAAAAAVLNPPAASAATAAPITVTATIDEPSAGAKRAAPGDGSSSSAAASSKKAKAADGTSGVVAVTAVHAEGYAAAAAAADAGGGGGEAEAHTGNPLEMASDPLAMAGVDISAEGQEVSAEAQRRVGAQAQEASHRRLPTPPRHLHPNLHSPSTPHPTSSPPLHSLTPILTRPHASVGRDRGSPGRRGRVGALRQRRDGRAAPEEARRDEPPLRPRRGGG